MRLRLTSITRRVPAILGVVGALGVLSLAAAAPAAAQTCVADCNSSGEVTLGEVQIAFNVFLGRVVPESCVGADADDDGEVELGEIQTGFNMFLGSCEAPLPGMGTTYFVRAEAGNDRNPGTSPGRALAHINAALGKVEAGDRVIVGPGVYEESVGLTAQTGVAGSPIVISADPGGALTGDPPGDVVVDASATTTPGIRVSGGAFVEIDGFSVRGGLVAGIQIRARQDTRSRDVTIRNCRVFDGQANADGILVQDADDTLLFNNLVYRNERRGIAVVGSPGARLINNTVAFNGNRGIFIVQRNGLASKDAFLRNNVSQGNVGVNLQVDIEPPSSIDGFDSQRNLVFPDRYTPPDLPSPSDINLDAQFLRALAGNFLLSQAAAGQGSTSPAVDAAIEENATGGPQADFATLRVRTTASDGGLDDGALDLGYHPRPDMLPPESVDWFVRTSGSDESSGTMPGRALLTIGEAATRAEPGDTIVVGPGTYREIIDQVPSGAGGLPIVFTADSTGERTGDEPGPVVVDARQGIAPFRLSDVELVTIDGFVLQSGAEAGVTIRAGSSGVTVRHCELFDNEVGVVVQNSSDVLLFDNLVIENDTTGIVVGGLDGSQDVRLVNNTVVGNGGEGIRIGTADNAEASDGLIQNNIVQENASDNLVVLEASLDDVAVRHNLVFPDSYDPPDLAHDSDVNADAAFAGAGVRLSDGSPAIDAGDPETSPALAAELAERSTRTDGSRDTGPLDLGYHFPR